MTPIPVLVLDDDHVMLHGLDQLLTGAGYQVHVAGRGDEGLAILDAHPEIRVILTDLKMPGLEGRDVLRAVKRRRRDTEVILFTGYGTVEDAVAAMKEGAWDYLTKPVMPEPLLAVLAGALERQDIVREVAARSGTPRIVTESPQMQELLALVRRTSESDSTVLIQGETGSGKELIARAIHAGGRRADRDLVALNCGCIPESLLFTELFGHEKGAFTGATRTTPGHLDRAQGGTLFLDEIAELSTTGQAALLRVLQEREFTRVGGRIRIPLDTRIISATNQDLGALVTAGRFRADLRYRLGVVVLEVPPLRERPEDILPLAEHFLEVYAARIRPGLSLGEEARLALTLDRWKGNVRELQNVIERAVVIAPGAVITPKDLGLDPVPPVALRGSPAERDRIVEALERTHGVRQDAARLLGMDRSTLWRKCRQWGIR
jgi:DNA-binding NtrC family response regulator